jgi:hypothetical protein
MTEAAQTAAASDTGVGAESQAGFCEKCFTGFKLDGQPAGRDTKIGPFTTYIAEPAQNANPEVAVVFWTDVFGLNVSLDAPSWKLG